MTIIDTRAEVHVYLYMKHEHFMDKTFFYHVKKWRKTPAYAAQLHKLAESCVHLG